MNFVAKNVVLIVLMSGFSQTLDAGVVGQWSFEEGPLGSAASGSNSILDSSGNSLHMTPEGGPIYRSVPNPNSTLGLEFTPNDLLSRADAPIFQLTSLTIEAFIRWDGNVNDELTQIFFRGDSQGGKDPYFLGVNKGKLQFNISDLSLSASNDLTLVSDNLLPVGEWVHVAGTLNTSLDKMKVYINGIQDGEKVAGGRLPNGSLGALARVSIGAAYDGGNPKGQFFDGRIDEVRLSDVALAPEDFLSANPIPEPTSIAIFGIGALCMGASAARRRRKEKLAVEA